MGFKKGLRIYSTVTDLTNLTQRYSIPYLTFVYHCKTNRFVYHKKEFVELLNKYLNEEGWDIVEGTLSFINNNISTHLNNK